MADQQPQEPEISENEKQMLQLLRSLKIEEPTQIAQLLVNGTKKEPEHPAEKDIDSGLNFKHHAYPKLSVFYGEDGKGETSWDCFKYEIECISNSQTYSEEQILFGIRRSVKGAAADKIRRLGPGATLRKVLEKLESSYGIVDTQGSIMRRFYTCEQKPNESVEVFSSRIEDLFDKGVELGSCRLSDTHLMKEVLYAGLGKDLKQMCAHLCDEKKDYDKFKREVRKIELDQEKERTEKKPCKPAVNMPKQEDETVKLLKQLNDRIGRIEQQQQERQSHQFDMPRHHDVHAPAYEPRGGFRGRYQGRGSVQGGYRGMNRGFRGQGVYRQSRPLGSNTFSPTCFICNKKGHFQLNCPTILEQLVCANCKEKGHIKRDCPNF